MTRVFLEGEQPADEIADGMVAAFSEEYDTEALNNDLIKATERVLAFIRAVEISDIDMILRSYVWFQMNYEDLVNKRNKKPLFGGLLKGCPKQSERVYLTAKKFKTYAFVLGNNKVALMPDD